MARQAAGAVTFPFGVAVGVGVGGAVGGALEPRLRALQNEAWQRFQSMPLEAQLAASLVASGERELQWGKDEAILNGINGDRFEALVDEIDTAPDLAVLLQLWRRRLISAGDFREGAKKGTIEDKWLDGLAALRDVLLSPAELANARQQGFIDPATQLDQAARQGVSNDHAEIQFELAGLPPGLMDVGMRLLRRGEISEERFAQYVREGHTKTKYTADLLVLRDEITSPTTAAGLWLRGWLSETEAKRIGALSGYGPEQMEHLYLNRGRPATVRQVHIGYARGAQLPGAKNEEEAIRTAVKQSNIRPEYADLLYEGRFTMPSPFVLRALTEDGTFSEEDARTILLWSGWVPDYAAKAARKWAGGGAGPSTKWADRARSRVFTDAWNDYLDGNADDADFRALLQAVGATGAEQDTIVTLATTVRGRTRRDLTQAQILKLYKKSIWIREQALAALLDLGMDEGDANDLLDAA